jgi:hypothetical protein
VYLGGRKKGRGRIKQHMDHERMNREGNKAVREGMGE